MLASALREQRQRVKERHVFVANLWHVDDDGVDLVFPNTLGWPRRGANVTRDLRAALKRAQLSPIRFHDLRHTAATLMLSNGIHPKLAADMLGHSTVAITMDTYSHVSPAMSRQAAETMDALFG